MRTGGNRGKPISGTQNYNEFKVVLSIFSEGSERISARASLTTCLFYTWALIFNGTEMKARIKWIENVAFLGETESGHAVVMDGSPDAGGRNLGPRPMETVLIGTGACSAFDVVLILKRGRQPIKDCVVELNAERAETDPKVFTKIHFHFIVTGDGLDRDKVARAIELSAEKYCSATAMLEKTASITHDFEIVAANAVPA
jgi:putative redox protein